MRLRTLVVLAVLAALAAGCGASAEEQVTETAKTFVTAIGDGESEKACDQLTDEVKKQFEQAGSCEMLFDGVAKAGNQEAFKKAAAEAKVEKIKVDGDNATAEVGGGTYNFKKVDGDWKISTLQ